MVTKGEIAKTNYVKRMVEVYEGKYLTNPYMRHIQGCQALFDQETIDFVRRNRNNVSQELFNKRSADPHEVSKKPTQNTAGTLRDWRPIQSRNDRSANAHGILRMSHDTVRVDSSDSMKQTASSIFPISSDVDIFSKETVPLFPSSYLSRNDGDEKSRLFPNLSMSNNNEFKDKIKEIWPNPRKSEDTKRRIKRDLFSSNEYVCGNENNMIICSSPKEPIMDNTISHNYDDSDDSLINSKRHDSVYSYKNLQIDIYDFDEEGKKKKKKKETKRQQEYAMQQGVLDSDQLQYSFTLSHSDRQTLKSLEFSYISPAISKNNTLMPRTSSKSSPLTFTDYIVNGKQCSQDTKSTSGTSSYHRSTTEFIGSKESMDDNENTSANWMPVMRSRKQSRKKSIKKLLSLFTKMYPSKINSIFSKGRSKKRSQNYNKYSTFVSSFPSPSYTNSTINLSSNVHYETPSTLPTFDTFRPRDSFPAPFPRNNQENYADNKSRLILTDASHKDLRTNIIPFHVNSHSSSMAVNKFPQSNSSSVVIPDIVVSSHKYSYPSLPKHPQLAQNIPKHPFIRITKID